MLIVFSLIYKIQAYNRTLTYSTQELMINTIMLTSAQEDGDSTKNLKKYKMKDNPNKLILLRL